MKDIVVPDGWRDRLEALGGTRREWWVAAGFVAVAVVVALAVWGRERPAVIAPPAVAAVAPAPSTTTTVLVHVAGAVRRPGVYELPAGARIADAVEAAGGPGRRADLDALNLAGLVADGAKVEVSRRGEAGGGAAVPAATASPGPVDLNTADQLALESIPGVGPVTAAAILQHRAEIGRFSAVEQLLDVRGIGPATLDALRPYVTV